MNLRRSFSVLLALALASPAFAAGQTPEAAQAELNGIQQDLQQSNVKVNVMSATLAETMKQQDEIALNLISLAASIKDQEQQIHVQDSHVKEMEGQAIILASDLAARQEELSKLLSGLMRLKQNPPPALVVQPDEVLQALRGAMLMGSVVPEFHRKASDVKDKIAALNSLRNETESEKRRQLEAMVALRGDEVRLQSLQQQKIALAQSTRTDLEAEKRMQTALADKAQNLTQLVDALRKAREEEQKRMAAVERAKAEKARAEYLKSISPFSRQLGFLHYPVAGPVLKNFGEATTVGGKLEGVAIAADANANVISPVNGTVEFAGPFRSYGQLLIVNAGEGYLVLLAGMDTISAVVGQPVRLGEPIGKMGQGQSRLALLGDVADKVHPVFYVEFRKGDSPVDPTPWWEAGRKEAMQ